MAGKNPREALENYLVPIRRAVACVANVHVGHTGSAVERVPHALTVNRGLPFRVWDKSGQIAHYLVIQQHYAVVQPEDPRLGRWKVRTLAYDYQILLPGSDEPCTVLAYHWHPNKPDVPFPHLHLDEGARIDLATVRDAHIPTGRIAIEDFLHLVIKGFKVAAVDGWEATLQETRSLFEQYRTWSGSGPTA